MKATHNKFVVELICQQRVWQLTEVHLQHRTNAVNILLNIISKRSWNSVLIKNVPTPHKQQVTSLLESLHQQ